MRGTCINYVSSENLTVRQYQVVCILHMSLIRTSFAGDLQSMSWLAMAFGGICGSLSGGYALTNLRIDTIFLLFSALPSLQLLSCALVEENSADSKVLLDSSNSKSSKEVNGNAHTIDGDGFLNKKSGSRSFRRKKSQKDRKKREAVSSKLQSVEKVDSLASSWFHSLKSAAYSLCRAFGKPIIFR